MTRSNNKKSQNEKEFYGKFLSVTFSILGLFVGFYSVIYSILLGVGSWGPEREKLLPILSFITISIILDCILGILSILGYAGYIRVRLSLTILSCLLVGIIGFFVLIRTLQQLGYLGG